MYQHCRVSILREKGQLNMIDYGVEGYRVRRHLREDFPIQFSWAPFHNWALESFILRSLLLCVRIQDFGTKCRPCT
jgi:hypothetical protein